MSLPRLKVRDTPPLDLSRTLSFKNESSQIHTIYNRMAALKLPPSSILDSPRSTNSVGTDEREFFSFAASGNLDGIQRMLNRGIPINVQDEWGQNALMYAAAENRVQMGEFLIGKGISINAHNMFEETAFNIAFVAGNKDFVDMLRDQSQFEETERKFSIGEPSPMLELEKWELHSEALNNFFENFNMPPPLVAAPAPEKKEANSNLTIEVIQGAYLYNLFPPNNANYNVHVRIEVGKFQFSTRSLSILQEGYWDEIQTWKEFFPCRIDPARRPSIKVLLCDSSGSVLGEFAVGFGWYGTNSLDQGSWFDLQAPSASTIKKTGFIYKRPTSLIDVADQTPHQMNTINRQKNSNLSKDVNNNAYEMMSILGSKSEEISSGPNPNAKPRLQLQIVFNHQNLQVLAAEQEMLSILSTYQTLHVDPLPKAVSQTASNCFTVILKEDFLLTNVEKNVERFLDQTNHKIATDLLRESFLNFQFSDKVKAHVIKQVIEVAEPTKNNLNQTIVGFTSSVLASWQLSRTNIEKFAQAFSHKHEEGFLASLGLHGPGKYLLPIWPKLVMAVVTTTYLILADTYRRYVDAYFSSRQRVFTKLLNPDYAGRLAGCIFEALVKHKLGRVSRNTVEEFLNFLLKFDEDEAAQLAPTAKHSKLPARFLVEWKKSARPFSQYKYITVRNYLGASSPSLLTQQVFLPEKKPPRLVDSNTMRNSDEILLMGAKTPPLNSAPQTPKSEDTSFASLLIKKMQQGENSPSLRLDALRSLNPTESNRALLISNLSEGVRDLSKLIPGVFFADPTTASAISLYNFFFDAKHVRVVNSTAVALVADKYDCLVVPASPWAHQEFPAPAHSALSQLEAICGTDFIVHLARVINQDYFGELPLGSSLLLPVDNDVSSTDDCAAHRPQYVVYTAFDERAVPYSALWSALLQISQHNRKVASTAKKARQSAIRSVVILSGDYYPQNPRFPNSKNAISKQLYAAYSRWEKSVVAGRAVIKDPNDVKEQLQSDPEDKREQRKREHFERLLVEGWIEARNFIDEPGIDMLIDCVIQIELPSDPKPRKASAKAATHSSSLASSLSSSSSSSSSSIVAKYFEFNSQSSSGGIARVTPRLDKDFFAHMEEDNSSPKFLIQKAAASALIHYTFPIERVSGTRKKLETLFAVDLLIEFCALDNLYFPVAPELVENFKPAQEKSANGLYSGTYKGQAITLKPLDSWGTLDTFREVALLSLLRHRNIAFCFGIVDIDSVACMLLEKLEGQILPDWLRSQKGQPDAVAILTIAVHLARALKHLHTLHMLHCNLSTSAVFVQHSQNSEQFAAKLLEFNSARTSVSPTHQLALDVYWKAPEVKTLSNFSEKSDIFALAMIYFELVTKNEPFHEMSHSEALSAIDQGKRPTLSKAQSAWCPSFSRLIEKCWNPRPDKRISAHDVILALTEVAEEFHLTFKEYHETKKKID